MCARAASFLAAWERGQQAQRPTMRDDIWPTDVVLASSSPAFVARVRHLRHLVPAF